MEKKSDDYEVALRSYTTTIKGLETDRSALLATAATKNERVATLEGEYQTLVRARETDLEQNREAYLVERHGHQSRRDAMLRAADALRDTIAHRPSPHLPVSLSPSLLIAYLPVSPSPLAPHKSFFTSSSSGSSPSSPS